jgi:ribosome-binding ATPase YchF (GTP1/OBG family)
METNSKALKAGGHEAKLKHQVFEKYKQALEAGHLASTVTLNQEEKDATKEVELLTTKPFLFVANSTFNLDTKKFEELPQGLPKNLIQIDAKIESELAELSPEEKTEYLKELGLEQSGLDKIIAESYKTLGLITFITAGEIETKAWTVTKGTKAPQAAGKIHTDFERGFIRAEVIAWDKLLEAGGYGAARDKGWLRTEGKEYIMQDGDVVHFRFNV